MSNFRFGRNRSFGGRSRHQSSRGSNRRRPVSTIHPSRYVNVGVPAEIVELPRINHTFQDFGLEPELLNNVLSHGYSDPTPIQDQTIPALMEGRDVVGLANTGTGKTASFLLPLINKVLLDPNQGVLILAPTRELAVQIQDEFRAFTQGLRISSLLVIGGANMQRQIFALKDNPHFVIGTPGRINDLIKRGAFDTRMFTNIVLDEVDRMLDIGFVRDIKFLISKLPEQRQSAFFSATINSEAETIMNSFLRNPVKVSVTTRQTSHHINQDVVKINPGESKTQVLHSLLVQAEFEKVIVFGRTKHGINKLERDLSRLGIKVSAIHGNKSQNARQRALTLFKRGQVQALLATDVAARGIDVENVSHVINFDEPQSYDDYVHRIGRTGRAGKMGQALTFVG